ncbi:hypothetical protein [Vallicoccus soli]|uniref:Uncharacterized protein n=1 Tax=Vallicoccus soli TaxID=2339232 RepID=A0A3A3YUE8_9ACTN|nr:hypothetical protein [Vallicoccus soli]RJK94325.1 hypothetical protein D5H78_15220 [Vallicoccus soli]
MTPASRRRPRYEAFIGTGAVAGVVLALVLAAVRPQVQGFSPSSVVLYLGLLLAVVGGLLGGLVAVGLERRAERAGRAGRSRRGR